MNQLNELEKLRKKAVIFQIVGVGLFACVFIFFFFSIARTFLNTANPLNMGGMFSLFPVAIIGVILCGFSSRYSKEYRGKVKTVYVLSCLNQLFEQVEYDYFQGFERDYIRSTELVRMGNRYSSNDLISASYKGNPFQMSDLLIQEESTDSDGNSQTTTLFSGQWFIFEFKKNFTGYLQLRDREDRLFRNGKPYGIFSERETSKEIKFENKEFNQMFTSYASNEQEAFYLITPHFMEKILLLKAQLEGELLIGFIDNQLHIALNSNKDLFEPSLWKEVDSSYQEEVLNDLKIVTSIIDELDLTK